MFRFAVRLVSEVIGLTAARRCDRQLEAMLAVIQQDDGGKSDKPRRRGRAKNPPRFDVRAYLFGVCGADLTRIDGIDTTTALKVVAAVGPDLSRFKSAKHFASWLAQCPGTKISGAKLLSGATKRTANRAAHALKLAAAGLQSSHSALDAYFRRMASRPIVPRPVLPPPTSSPASSTRCSPRAPNTQTKGRPITKNVTASACCITSPRAPSNSASN